MSGNQIALTVTISQTTAVLPNGGMTVTLVDKTRAYGDQNVRATVDQTVGSSTVAINLGIQIANETNTRVSGDASLVAQIVVLQSQIAALQTIIAAPPMGGSGELNLAQAVLALPLTFPSTSRQPWLNNEVSQLS